MIRTIKYTAAILALALLPACTTVRQHTTVVDKRLIAPKSYSFLPDKSVLAAEEAGVSNAPYWHRQTEKAIERVLEKKGYVRTREGRGDLVIAFHRLDQWGKNFTVLDNYSGYRLSAKEQREQAESIAKLVANVKPGKERHTLVIDVIDPEQREVVWREMTHSNATLRSTAKNQKYIEEAVEKILKHFPQG